MESIFTLEGQVALVTGGARGIGEAVVYAFSVAGARVVISDIDMEKAGELEREMTEQGYLCEAIYTDVSDSESFDKAIEYVIEKFGKLDILVNNTGILIDHFITDISDEEWERVTGINYNGTFYGCRAAIRHMRERRKGCIINMASMGGKMAFALPGVHYCSTKAAMISMTRHLTVQESSNGIKINAVAPGTTLTDMVAGRGPEKLKSIAERVPLKRLGKPEEIAAAVLFLASSASSYIAGETIDLNGGLYMN